MQNTVSVLENLQYALSKAVLVLEHQPQRAHLAVHYLAPLYPRGGRYIQTAELPPTSKNNNYTHVAVVGLTPLTMHPHAQAGFVRSPVGGQEQKQPDVSSCSTILIALYFIIPSIQDLKYKTLYLTQFSLPKSTPVFFHKLTRRSCKRDRDLAGKKCSPWRM